MEDRIKPLDGVRNFRDFGGYLGVDGRRVKPGLLFRSGHYAHATEADMETLETLNIGLQVDLRRPDERERDVAKWPGSNVAVVTNDGGRETEAPHQRFLKKVDADPVAADNWMNEYYEKAPFKPHHIALYTAWFERLAGLGAEDAAVINCAAGKDRTGIACALTKHALGVAEDDIVSDYVLTNRAVDVDARLPEATQYFNTMLEKNYAPDVYRPFLGVHERYLRTALTTIEREAGSIDVYLTDALDVTEAKQEALRARLLEPA